MAGGTSGGRPDPASSLRLLWRGHLPAGAEVEEGARRGRPASLSVDAVVEAAIGLADAEGMDAVSMRSVADRLGRTPMALYTYVPGKEELAELMHDHALGELPRAYDADTWREGVADWVQAHWHLYLRHPWMLQVGSARPALGPHEFADMEALSRVFDQAGLGAVRQARVMSALTQLVRGSALLVAETREATRRTGVGEAEWWYARSARLDEVAPHLAELIPSLSRLSAAGAFDGDESEEPYLEREARQALEEAVTLLLDGAERAADVGGS